MITARNYAAQAEKFMREIAARNANKFEVSSRNAMAIAETIKKAQHFAIPDGGALFDDKLKGLDLSNIRLPYPDITVEWFIDKPKNDGKYPCPKRIIVASEVEDFIVCVGVWYSHEIPKGCWGFNPFKIFIKMDNSVPFPSSGFGDIVPFRFEDGREIQIAPAFTQDQFAENLRSGEISSKEALEVLQDSTLEMMGLFEFLEALSCKNVIAEPLEKIDHAKNIRRIRDGKLPIYETRILTIDTGRNSGEKHDSWVGAGDRASVRQHLRRGHIRRHPTAGNIWVNSCVVGYSELGVINKSYEVH